MRFLADENFPAAAVEALRLQGHDVKWIRVDAPGSTDTQILEQATAEARILLTFDKDFGELAFRAGLPASSGIILFRIPLASPSQAARIAVRSVESRRDWGNHFSVVEAGRIRMTPLPRYDTE
jgi:predicted nuclease of predicted toxin-antitoxin system